jgi:hypothetical protein
MVVLLLRDCTDLIREGQSRREVGKAKAPTYPRHLLSFHKLPVRQRPEVFVNTPLIQGRIALAAGYALSFR